MPLQSSAFEMGSSAGDSVLADFDFIAYHARTNGRRIACIDLAANRSVTFGEFDSRIAICTGWLRGLLEPGARVAMLARNGLDSLVLHFACIRAGLVYQPLNWRLSGRELGILVGDAMPELLIYQTEFEDAAGDAMQACAVRHVVRIAPDDDRLAAALDTAEPDAGADFGPDVPVTLLYTSGTTGKPKGVIVTRRNAWATAFNFSFANEVAPRDVLLCDMPLFHVAGLFGVARGALYAGAAVLISDRFVPSDALARMSDPRLAITHYFAVPQMAMTMLQDPSFATSDLSRLKALVIGGAPLPKSVVDRLLAGGVMPIEGYGLSEGGTVFATPLDRDTVARKAGTSGVKAPMIEVRLVTSDGHEAAEGEVGEIWLKGPSMTPGYWNQKEATAKAFADGWFKTGDAARRDGDGFYQIVDRWKDMYITGGENVYPAEVESVLAEHPAIAEAAVIGVPDAKWGESGCAYVVLREHLIAADVIAHVRGRLARYKVPKHVAFVDTLPRTGSGKVKKDDLRRIFREGAS
ncbi:MAG TPA: AMP-binding protein [Rhizomicrobium sp.]